MNTILKWLGRNGYTAEIRQYTGEEPNTIVNKIVVDIDYYGIYAPSKNYDILHKIQRYIKRCHPNYSVDYSHALNYIKIFEK